MGRRIRARFWPATRWNRTFRAIANTRRAWVAALHAVAVSVAAKWAAALRRIVFIRGTIAEEFAWFRAEHASGKELRQGDVKFAVRASEWKTHPSAACLQSVTFPTGGIGVTYHIRKDCSHHPLHQSHCQSSHRRHHLACKSWEHMGTLGA